MKTYNSFYLIIICFLSIKSHGQNNNNTNSQTEIPKDERIIIGYYIEDISTATFGGTAITYQVSSLSMLNNYLGPNNTRIITPIYKKEKIKPDEINLESNINSKAITLNPTIITLEPVKIKVVDSLATPKKDKEFNDAMIDIVSIYTKAVDNGYKSVDMLTKVADRCFFNDDFESAAKYYEQLFTMTTNLEAIYYFRYAQSLKAINQTAKANEMMKLYEMKK